jgi:hypothetical protein
MTMALRKPGCHALTAERRDEVLELAPQHTVARRGDALELLKGLPDGCSPLVFFDPQHRAVLDKLSFGNEHARQRGRFALPAMTDDYIDSVWGQGGRYRCSRTRLSGCGACAVPTWCRR